MRKNNVYLKRIFRLLLVSISFPIVWFFLYLNNEGWGIDANPTMFNCIVDFILSIFPLIGLIISIILFTIDFLKNKNLVKRINSVCFLVFCLLMVINIIQKYIIANNRIDISYVNRCSYVTPNFAHKLPFLSMWGFILSIILGLGSYFCFSSLEGKKIWIKVLKVIVGFLLLISGICSFLSSIGKII